MSEFKHPFYQFLEKAIETTSGHFDSNEDDIKKFKEKFNSWVKNSDLNENNKGFSLTFKNESNTNNALDFLICLHYIGENEFKDSNCHELIPKLIDKGILKEKNKKNSYQFNFSGQQLKDKLSHEFDYNDADRIWKIVEQYHYYDLKNINFSGLNCEDYKFNYSVRFDNSHFFDFTCFQNVTFKRGVSFTGSTFHKGVSFAHAKFLNGSVSFTAVNFKNRVDLSFTEFKEVENICFKEFKTEELFIFESKFKTNKSKITFDKATINGTFSFDVNTNSPVDFSKANITGGGINITDRDSWRKLSYFCNDIKKREAYVFLKDHYRNKGDVKRELEYSFMELEAEYQQIKWKYIVRKFPLFLYRWFSLYGSSIIIPLLWILVFLFLSELYNNDLCNFVVKICGFAWLESSFILNKLNLIFPILNINSEQINNVPDALVSLFSIPLLFLFGLGLRNRFKLR